MVTSPRELAADRPTAILQPKIAHFFGYILRSCFYLRPRFNLTAEWTRTTRNRRFVSVFVFTKGLRPLQTGGSAETERSLVTIPRTMILCLGITPTVQRSIVFDRLRIGDVNRTADVTEYASGKSINVARVIRTLGHDVVATGLIGGSRGRFVCEDIAAAKART